MSKKFYARDGNNYWKPNPAYKEQKLAMLSDGSLVILTDMVKEGWNISSLPKEYKYTEKRDTEPQEEVKKEKCPACLGSGEGNEIVDHDENGAVYAKCQCWKCHGSGVVVKK